LPDGPRTDPGVRFSRTGLFSKTRFRITAHTTSAKIVAFVTLLGSWHEHEQD
jgi:hypothetical protein